MKPYRSLDEVYADAQSLGTLREYGTSAEGRALVALDLGGEGPVVVVTAGLHGIEYIGVHSALEVAKQGPLEGAHLFVLPVLNPDGYARTWRDQGNGNVRIFRKNARGVDLNRNFPLPWGATSTTLPILGGSSPQDATYRGEAPLSEPESAALADWMVAHEPHASANLHSFMGVLISARVWHRTDWRGYTRLGKAFRANQTSRLGYPRIASPLLDVFTGELEDWQHHCLRCWSVCVEHFFVFESLRQHLRAPNGFWRFNPRAPDSIAARDAPAIRGMLAEAVQMPRPPARPGAQTALPIWTS